MNSVMEGLPQNGAAVGSSNSEQEPLSFSTPFSAPNFYRIHFPGELVPIGTPPPGVVEYCQLHGYDPNSKWEIDLSMWGSDGLASSALSLQQELQGKFN